MKRIHSTYTGPILTLIGVFFFTIAHSLIKGISGQVNTTTIIFFRMLLPVALIVPLLASRKLSLNLKNYPWLFIRLTAGLITMVFFVLSLKYGDLGRSILIFQTYLIWIVMVNAIFKHHDVHFVSKACIPFCIIGIAIILKPDGEPHFLGDMYALLASIGNTFVYYSLNKLRKENQSLSIIFFFSIISLLILLPYNVETLPTIPQPALMTLIAMGVTGFIGQVAFTSAHKYSSPTTIGVLNMLLIPATTLIGVIIFHETFTSTQIIGSVITTLSLLLVAKYQ